MRKIAAGEVVENPASCVRELIENALDEGATELFIEVQDSGKRSIRVRDNGSGMERDEIPLAVERYTTRKIREARDLDRITTLGFRGEALHAIAAVSKLTLISRTDSTEMGFSGRFEAGEPKGLEPAAHPVGTSVLVENLFYNVPARRKFLKSDLKETRNVIESVTSYALCHPKVSFTLVLEGERVLDLPATGPLESRIEDVYGRT